MNLVKKTYVLTKKGNQFEIDLPAKRIICPTCDGKGSHVNRAIDGHGLGAEDFDDPDFAESYFAGHYDVRCEECDGEKIILEIDWDRLTPKMQERVDRQIESDRADDGEARHWDRVARHLEGY